MPIHEPNEQYPKPQPETKTSPGAFPAAKTEDKDAPRKTR